VRTIARGLLSRQNEIGCHQAVTRRKTQRDLLTLDHSVRNTESPYDRRSGWYEQAGDRQDYEALEHVKSHRGADALAPQDVAKLMQRHAEP